MHTASPVGRATATIVLISLGCAADVRLEDRVADFVEAHNAYSTDQLSAYVTNDVRIVEFDGRVQAGATAFLARVGWDSVSSTQWTLDSVRLTDDSTVTAQLSVTSTWHQLLGVGTVIHDRATFLFRDACLAELRVGPLTPDSREQLELALANFLAWAQHEYPQRLDRIRPHGLLDYQARRAADWLALIREWQTGER